MEAVINKTRAEILHGISAEELEQLIKLIAKLEHNIIELQAKGEMKGRVVSNLTTRKLI